MGEAARLYCGVVSVVAESEADRILFEEIFDLLRQSLCLEFVLVYIANEVLFQELWHSQLQYPSGPSCGCPKGVPINDVRRRLVMGLQVGFE